MVSITLLQKIGKQIAKVRIRAGLTPWALNRSMGFAEPKSARDNSISKLEKGEVNITLETLEAIAKKCGCRVEVTIIRDRTITPVMEHEVDGNRWSLLNKELTTL